MANRWSRALPLEIFLATVKPDRPPRVPGTAVFMVPNDRVVPAALLYNIKHDKVLQGQISARRLLFGQSTAPL